MSNQYLFNAMKRTLKAVRNHFGLVIFEDHTRFMAAVNDLATGEESTRVRNLLRIAICDLHAYSRLKKAQNEGNTFIVGQLTEQMSKDFMLPEEITSGVIECIAYLLGYKSKAKPAPAAPVLPDLSLTNATEPVPSFLSQQQVIKPLMPSRISPLSTARGLAAITEQVEKSLINNTATPSISQGASPSTAKHLHDVLLDNNKQRAKSAYARSSHRASHGGEAASLMVGSTMRFGPFNWRVLEAHKTKALLISENVLESKRYHTKQGEGITWADCALRHYLNASFYGLFDTVERSQIIDTRTSNTGNPWFNTRGGHSTIDRVFLLNIEEAVKYFGDSGQLRARQDAKQWRINDRYSELRKATNLKGENTWWWLRSPGQYEHGASFVSNIGYIVISGRDAGDSGANGGGVRPALWVHLN